MRSLAQTFADEVQPQAAERALGLDAEPRQPRPDSPAQAAERALGLDGELRSLG